MNIDDFVKRTDEIIGLGSTALAHKTTGDYGGWIQKDEFGSFRSAALSLLMKLFGDRHPYYTDFNEKVTSTDASDIEVGLGILRSVKAELVGGWLVSARGLISAEIFADFLEMAEYLLAERYKDAAAVWTCPGFVERFPFAVPAAASGSWWWRASCTLLASARCGSTNSSSQAPALPVCDTTLCVAQRRPRDLNPEHGACMSDHQVTDGFGKGGSAFGNGILGCERTDERAPLGVREAHVDPVAPWIGQRRSSALAH